MDIVGYSKLPLDRQEAVLRTLQAVVCVSPEFLQTQDTEEMIRLPTGDGMALVFFEDAEAATRCALEVSRALKSHPEIPLRMGLHSGPVYRVADINANQNVAGGGINIAQRVMDCGDAGHILASQSVADVLGQLSSWKDCLHDLGEADVKHGVRVHLYNLYTEEVGNAELPQKLQTARRRLAAMQSKARRRKLELGMVAAGVIAAFAGWLFLPRHAHALSEKDTIVLSDFTNSTGDAIFDDTLKTALTVSLRQSPFLNVLPDSEVTKTLQEMTRPVGTKLTPEVARELCERVGSKAYLAGTIHGLGSQYVLGLKAVNCQSGDTLAQEQATAASKEKVLDVLSTEAAKLRGELGESLATVQKFDVPLSDATTSSLEALKAYSQGVRAANERGAAAALAYYQRAIQLDPDFAMGYRAVGGAYESQGESGSGREYYAKAFALREHASELEKMTITIDYYAHVTGEWERTVQPLQEWIANYPRSYVPHRLLANAYSSSGDREKSCEEMREALRLAPDSRAPNNLALYLIAAGHFDEARQVIKQAEAKQLDTMAFHQILYALAFLGNDSATMEEQLQWFAGKPEENEGVSLAADTEAFVGRLTKARELSNKTTKLAVRADQKENGAIWKESAALREAAYGNSAAARQLAAEGLVLFPDSLGTVVQAALAFAMAGDAARAGSLARDLTSRYPLNIHVRSIWLPAVHAALALNRGKPAEAVKELEAGVSSIEWGLIPFTENPSCLYLTYMRGVAYLASGQATAAAGEFQKILDHRGMVWNCWTGALAHLGVARANALQARTSQGAEADAARVRALTAYKDFLTLWKDADPDIPVLKEAKAEYAKLQ
jgi:tetratricopeptide (TPR) repeat protein